MFSQVERSFHQRDNDVTFAEQSLTAFVTNLIIQTKKKKKEKKKHALVYEFGRIKKNIYHMSNNECIQMYAL